MTAVEWLLEHDYLIRSTKWPDIIEQAKAMEKEQIILANEDCSTNELGEFISGEQYYNETYGK
jgi:hypothetical protein